MKAGLRAHLTSIGALSKPCRPHPELDRLMKESAERFAAMTPEEQEVEMRKQRESWARQDMD